MSAFNLGRRISAAGLLAICLIATLVGYCIPLLHWSHTTGFDWDLFDGYSLVLRSNLLQYHQLPLHDPWVSGGLDLLANPQTRTFSPLFLADLLFAPHGANLLSLVVFGFAGLLGMYFLLRERGISWETSFAGAIVFTQSSWFGLHYAEGHIAYGSMQLLPWVLYFGLKLENAYAFFGLLSTIALMVLDGGIYAAVYSVLLLLFGAIAGLVHPSTLFRGGRGRVFVNVLSLLAVSLLVSIKVVPVLLLTAKIKPQLEFTTLGFFDLIQAFFNPLQKPTDVMNVRSTYRFHEFGCYLSPLGLALIASRFRALRADRVNWVILWLMMIFLWIGSGLGGVFNPWHLLQRVPLVNMAHIQSRLFILAALFFLLLLAPALELMRARRGLWVALLSVLALEAFFVKSYPFYSAYQGEKPAPALALIPKTSIRGVRDWGTKPDLYFSGDYSYLHTYERAAPDTNALSEHDTGYRGLAYVLAGEGSVTVESFTPGQIELSYFAASPVRAEINANYLGGWALQSGEVRVSRNGNGLIGLELEPGEGRAVLLYRPRYLPYTLAAYSVGVLLWLALALHFLRSRAGRE